MKINNVVEKLYQLRTPLFRHLQMEFIQRSLNSQVGVLDELYAIFWTWWAVSEYH